MNKGVAPILGMADLACLYKEKLKWLRLSVPQGRIYTRSNLLLVSVIPDLVTCTGQNIVLTFDNVNEHALGQVCDHDGPAVHLARAADIDKIENFWKLLRLSKIIFIDISFRHNCQQQTVPRYLQATVNMVLAGANIKYNIQFLHVSLLLVFKNHVKSSITNSTTVCHTEQDGWGESGLNSGRLQLGFCTVCMCVRV